MADGANPGQGVEAEKTGGETKSEKIIEILFPEFTEFI